MTFETFERPTAAVSDSVWSGVQQTVVDEAVDEWRRHLRACVSGMGRHFEHLLQ